MRHRTFAAVLLCVVLLLSACADRGGESVGVKKEKVRPERDESLYYEDNTVFHIGLYNEMQLLIPRVPDPVPPEEFTEAYGPILSEGSSVDCVRREQIGVEKPLSLGLFYPEEDGSLSKVCTDPGCRADPSLPCDHLTTPYSAVRYGDAVYFAVDFRVPEGNPPQFAVLEWKIGGGNFDKLFESEDPIFDLFAVNGILYIRTAPNLEGAGSVWYAVRMDREIAVEIPVRGILLFGENGIVEVGDGGVTLLDELLYPVRTLLGERTFGAVAGGYFWYVGGNALWRIPLEDRAKPEKFASGVTDFNISETYLWTVGEEDGAIRRSEWRKKGSSEILIFRPEEGETVSAFGMAGPYRKPVCGDSAWWTAIKESAGKEVCAAAFSDGKNLTVLWEE